MFGLVDWVTRCPFGHQLNTNTKRTPIFHLIYTDGHLVSVWTQTVTTKFPFESHTDTRCPCECQTATSVIGYNYPTYPTILDCCGCSKGLSTDGSLEGLAELILRWKMQMMGKVVPRDWLIVWSGCWILSVSWRKWVACWTGMEKMFLQDI